MKPKEIAKLRKLIEDYPGPIIFAQWSSKDLARYIAKRLFVEEKEIRVDDQRKKETD